jgi:hypothetical protein
VVAVDRREIPRLSGGRIGLDDDERLVEEVERSGEAATVKK